MDCDETVRLAKEVSVYSYLGKPLRAWLDKAAEYAADFEYESAVSEIGKMCREFGIRREQS